MKDTLFSSGTFLGDEVKFPELYAHARTDCTDCTGGMSDMLASKASNSKKRVQLDFTLQALGALDRIKERVSANSRAEVIRQALSIYDWLIEQLDARHTFLIKQGEEVKEVVIPIIR